ncbi:hypothetical protein [Ornithinimicrobium panacihumi]|uniref:hypothetical protein n=1 Tax=Ornithinimicrobium panacihumi TaxID=2008449 RepID=UPI003F8CBE23
MATTTEPDVPAPEDPSLGVLAILAASRSGLDARLIEGAALTVASTGHALLAHKGFTSVEELTPAQRKKWRAEAKRLTCAELEVKLGLGVHEARVLVGLACAPAPTRDQVVTALDRGWATWTQAKAFWERCGSLPHEQGALVAEAMFGAEAATADRARLDPDGDLRDSPWQHDQYRAALERQALAVEGADVQAERARRRAAYAARRAGMTVHDDGTATLTLTGPLVTMCGVHTRIDRIARLLRKAGDPRTLDQLRCDVAAALLLHGTLDFPEGHEEDLSPADLERISMIVNAQPAVHVKVIVPWDVLSGQAACAHCQEPLELPGADSVAQSEQGQADQGQPDRGQPDQGQPDQGQPGKDVPPADSSATVPSSGATVPSSGAVGEIIGRHPAFISPGHARELAIQPGTILSRLLTDPVDGRLVLEPITSYRPNAEMRRHIAAADVYSRAPGPRQPMVNCELDHVVPWGPVHEGPTAVRNLAGLSKRPHDFKTKGWWDCIINDRRDLTWSTLLGQSYATRPHDYRQYFSGPALGRPWRQALDDAAPVDPALSQGHPAERVDLEDRLHLINQALYAALAHRGAGAFLLDEDDHPGTGEHGGPLAGWMWITHTSRKTGRRRAGAPADAPTPEDVLGLVREGPAPEHEQEQEQSQKQSQEHSSPPPKNTPWDQRECDEPPPF